MSAGRKSARNTPLLGDAFLISAMTAGCPRCIRSRSAAAKSRGAGAASTRPERVLSGRRSARAHISSLLRATIRRKMSGVSTATGHPATTRTKTRASLFRISPRERDELLELGARRTALDHLPRAAQALGNGRRHIRRIQGRAGVERDDIPLRARTVGEHRQYLFLRRRRIGHLERIAVIYRQTELSRVDGVFPYFAVHQLPDHGLARQRHLIQPIHAVNDQHVPTAEALQHAHLYAHQVRMKHAQQLIRRAGRVGQRPEDIEDRAHPELFAHRCRMFHGAMVIRREHETDPGLGDTIGDLRRRQVDMGAERFEHVRASRLARYAAATVLCHARAGRGGGEHGSGGNIEGMRGVAARADDIEQMLLPGHFDLGRELAHDLRGGGDLADGFLLYAQTDDEGADQDRRQLTAHDRAHQREHLVVKDLAVLDDALQRFLRGYMHVRFSCATLAQVALSSSSCEAIVLSARGPVKTHPDRDARGPAGAARRSATALTRSTLTVTCRPQAPSADRKPPARARRRSRPEKSSGRNSGRRRPDPGDSGGNRAPTGKYSASRETYPPRKTRRARSRSEVSASSMPKPRY